MTERTFDRVVKFDERSRNFPMTTVLEAVKEYKPRSYTWNLYKVLDQGREGACVGFGWSHELQARPVVIREVTDFSAQQIYKQAQKIDEWEGEAYSGTSVLAGAKIVKQLGFIQEYRWIFADANEIIKTLGYFGPVVCGMYWHEDMFDTDEEGMIYPTGNILGGHCILANGILINKKDLMRSKVKFVNSWGEDWGVGGSCYMYLDHFLELIRNNGEICVPVARRQAIVTK